MKEQLQSTMHNASRSISALARKFRRDSSKDVLIKEGKIIAISLTVGVVVAIVLAAFSYMYAHGVQQGIANNVIRFHVRANSNSTIDQQIKETVRLQVLSQFESYLSASIYIEETRATLTKKLEEIQEYAASVVQNLGFSYPVTADIAQVFFPTTFYGSLSFPPGQYEAVQIIIGQGEGSNWWCLMFPPLCYVDMTATATSRLQLANTVPEEGVRLLTHQEQPSSSLVIRFRIVEWWQSRNQPTPRGIYVNSPAF